MKGIFNYISPKNKAPRKAKTELNRNQNTRERVKRFEYLTNVNVK